MGTPHRDKGLGENAAKETDEHIRILLDTMPFACRLWDKDFRIFECNEATVKLFGLKNKQEYFERHFELSPELQPNGQRSYEKTVELLQKVLKEGRLVFEWMHRTVDGEPLPVEITLVRVAYQDDFVIAGYSRDLREQTALLNAIHDEQEKFITTAHWYEYILDSFPLPITVQDMNGNFSFINAAAEKTFRVRRKDVIGKPCKSLGLTICNTEDCAIACAKRGLTRTYFTYENASYQADVKMMRDLRGEAAGYIEVIQDITKLEHMTRQQEEERTRVITEASPVSYILLDENMAPMDCNSEALRFFKCPDKQRLLDHYWDHFTPASQPDGQNSLQKARAAGENIFTGERSVFEWQHLSSDGKALSAEITLTHLAYKQKKFIIAFIYDLSNIKKLEENIEQLKTEVDKIYYDQLTGIYNRRYFDENMNRIIRLLSRSGGVISVMMIDIDYFKYYNDTYGHNEGDKCLKNIAKILDNAITRADDFVARYGGEEFVVVLPNTDEQGARLLADKILNSVRKRNIPHSKSDAASCVTVSVGVATKNVQYPHDGASLVKSADEMLYESKNAGRDRYTCGTCDN